jgi:hypothetical protein
VVTSSSYEEGGTRVEALVEQRHLDTFAPFVVAEVEGT